MCFKSIFVALAFIASLASAQVTWPYFAVMMIQTSTGFLDYTNGDVSSQPCGPDQTQVQQRFFYNYGRGNVWLKTEDQSMYVGDKTQWSQNGAAPYSQAGDALGIYPPLTNPPFTLLNNHFIILAPNGQIQTMSLVNGESQVGFCLQNDPAGLTFQVCDDALTSPGGSQYFQPFTTSPCLATSTSSSASTASSSSSASTDSSSSTSTSSSSSSSTASSSSASTTASSSSSSTVSSSASSTASSSSTVGPSSSSASASSTQAASNSASGSPTQAATSGSIQAASSSSLSASSAADASASVATSGDSASPTTPVAATALIPIASTAATGYYVAPLMSTTVTGRNLLVGNGAARGAFVGAFVAAAGLMVVV
ncbi:hypothetical protein HDU98_006779 [Podochytrium sp. JEL0797]|nr:hypothetical protein HDU98_006779 [Podochytrium sp. JEL0797]